MRLAIIIAIADCCHSYGCQPEYIPEILIILEATRFAIYDGVCRVIGALEDPY
jgi:hypothetical protein